MSVTFGHLDLCCVGVMRQWATASWLAHTHVHGPLHCVDNCVFTLVVFPSKR